MTVYTLQGRGKAPVYNAATGEFERDADGAYTYAPRPDVSFRSAMEMLHWATRTGLIRHHVGGVTRHAITIYLGSEQDAHRGYRCAGDGRSHDIPNEVWDAMKRAQDRAKGLLHYLREVEPEWRNIEKIHYADNSVVMAQRDKYGRYREVTLTAPHGDACF